MVCPRPCRWFSLWPNARPGLRPDSTKTPPTPETPSPPALTCHPQGCALLEAPDTVAAPPLLLGHTCMRFARPSCAHFLDSPCAISKFADVRPAHEVVTSRPWCRHSEGSRKVQGESGIKSTPLRAGPSCAGRTEAPPPKGASSAFARHTPSRQHGSTVAHASSSSLLPRAQSSTPPSNAGASTPQRRPSPPSTKLTSLLRLSHLCRGPNLFSTNPVSYHVRVGPA